MNEYSGFQPRPMYTQRLPSPEEVMGDEGRGADSFLRSLITDHCSLIIVHLPFSRLLIFGVTRRADRS